LVTLFGVATLADRLDWWMFNPFNWRHSSRVLRLPPGSRARGGRPREAPLDSADSVSVFVLVRRAPADHGAVRRADLTRSWGIEIDLRAARSRATRYRASSGADRSHHAA
jgi:hypothetical protein